MMKTKGRLCTECGLPKTLKKLPGAKSEPPLCWCKGRTSAMNVEGLKTPTTFLINPVKRLMGLEIEIAENTETIVNEARKAGIHASVVHDGTVRPSQQEAVLPPYWGDALVDKVATFCACSHAWGGTVNETCGVHVHIDASTSSIWEIRGLLLAYERMEDEFYRLVPVERQGHRDQRHGGFAKRLTPTLHDRLRLVEEAKTHRDVAWALAHFLYGVSPGALPWGAKPAIANQYDESRYFGLNLHTWYRRGTVEFRHLEGTLDPRTILSWAILCGRFVEFAPRSKSFEELVCNLPPMVRAWVRERRELYGSN